MVKNAGNLMFPADSVECPRLILFSYE